MITFPILATTALVFLILLYGAAWHDEQARPKVIRPSAMPNPRRSKRGMVGPSAAPLRVKMRRSYGD